MIHRYRKTICVLLLFTCVNSVVAGGAQAVVKTSAQTLPVIDEIRQGSGHRASSGDLLTVHFACWLYDPDAEGNRGRLIHSTRDSGAPFSFTLGKGVVIQALEVGANGMQEGGLRRLVIPSSLVFGDDEVGGGVPKGSTLILEIELINRVHPSDVLRAIDAVDSIEFASGTESATIFAFVDLICPYSRKLIADIPTLNKAGLSVVLIPIALRHEVGRAEEESAASLTSVMCSNDRKEALRVVMSDRNVSPAQCKEDFLTRSQNLADLLLIKGTPAIFSATGSSLHGYMPPAQLLQILKIPYVFEVTQE